MSIKQALTIALTKRTLLAIEKVISLNCSIKGIENIPKSSSIIFAPNHFTRFETFLVPHILNKINGLKFSRSLAFSSLFTSILGKYLTNLKTLSTSDPNRDEIIINDLAHNNYNWVIYPEGHMVKDKKREVYNGLLQSRLSIKTGAVVLAIKAEIIRQKNHTSPHSVCIIPTTISYLPLAPGDNGILNLARKLAKKLPKRLEEELTVEGSILLHSKIIIHFDKPIFISDYTTKEQYLSKILQKTEEDITKTKIAKYRIPIALRLAQDIYKNAVITHEHIISLLLKHSKGHPIRREKILFYVISTILDLKKYSNIMEWSETLKDEKLFNDFHHLEQDITNFLNLLTAQHLIRIENDLIYTEEKFYQEQDFECIRIENIAMVFLNEIIYFTNVETIVKNIFKATDFVLTKICLNGIGDAYLKQHKLTYNATHSIQTKYGQPILMHNSKERAILLIHGYKSSPFEMHSVAKSLYGQGFTCYCARMAGHGTSPFDMANTTQDNWYHSIEIAYKILSLSYKEVCVYGFSTGGLIAMRLATNYNIPKITLINAALQLEDIRFRYVKFAKMWSDMAHKFDKDHKGYIEDIPYFSDTNYSINHFSCMAELAKLMKYCRENMKRITSETLVIQSDADPIVSPRSGELIYHEICTVNKKLKMIPSKDHVITRGATLPKLINIIEEFCSIVRSNNTA